MSRPSLTPGDDPSDVLGVPGSALPQASNEPCDPPPAFQVQPERGAGKPSPEAEPAAARLPDRQAAELAMKPAAQTPAEPSDRTAEQSGPARARSWALAFAVCRLRFVDGLPAVTVHKRLGVDHAYYAACMRWLLDEVVPTLSARPLGPRCDRRAIAYAVANLAPMAITRSVNEHATECADCAAFTHELFAAAATFVTTEKHDVAAPAGRPILRHPLTADELSRVRRLGGPSRQSGHSRATAAAAADVDADGAEAEDAALSPACASRRPRAMKIAAGVMAAIAGVTVIPNVPSTGGGDQFADDAVVRPANTDAGLVTEPGGGAPPPPTGPPEDRSARAGAESEAPPGAGQSPPSAVEVARRAGASAVPRPRDVALAPAASAATAVDLASHDASIADAKSRLRAAAQAPAAPSPPAARSERVHSRPAQAGAASRKRHAATFVPSQADTASPAAADPPPRTDGRAAPAAATSVAAPEGVPQRDASDTPADADADAAFARSRVRSALDAAAGASSTAASNRSTTATSPNGTDGHSASSPVVPDSQTLIDATAKAALTSAREQIAAAFQQAEAGTASSVVPADAAEIAATV